MDIQKANETAETVALASAVHDATADFNMEQAMDAVEAQAPAQTPHELAETNETRRGKHSEWLLIGIQNGTPVWKYDWAMAELNQKYPPAKLRALRAERGVGSKAQRLKHQMSQIALDNAT